jgi:hypothetical protein
MKSMHKIVISHNRIRSGYVACGLWLVFLTMLCLISCAPSIYSIDMKYQAGRDRSAATSGNGKVRVTTASFEDMRKTQDKMMIGKVIKLNGGQIPVAPKYRTPQDAIALGFKEYFSKSGFTVSGERPFWNLQESSIQSQWGDVVVGGSIDELEVICRDELPTKKYQTTVKLTVFFADVQKRQILLKTSAQSSASLEHVFFSEEKMQQLLNETLSDAIEKVFEDGKAERKILDAVKKQ